MTNLLPPLRQPSFQSRYCWFPPGHTKVLCVPEKQLLVLEIRRSWNSSVSTKGDYSFSEEGSGWSGHQPQAYHKIRSPKVSFSCRGCIRPFTRSFCKEYCFDFRKRDVDACTTRRDREETWTLNWWTRTSIHLMLQSDWFKTVDIIKKAVLYLCIHVYIYIIYIYTYTHTEPAFLQVSRYKLPSRAFGCVF